MPKKKSRAPRERVALDAAIELMLKDAELRNRCTDLLKAKGHFDRVFREATTVLDDRLRRLSGIADAKISPVDLAAKVLHPSHAILRVSPDNEEQEGFFHICLGLFKEFRNPTHHKLTAGFTREDAFRFCGFVDLKLAILAKAQKQPT